MDINLFKSYSITLIKLYILILFIFTNSFAQEEKKTYAFLNEVAEEFKVEKSKSIIKILLDEIFENSNANFDVKVYNDYNIFLKDLKNNKINFLNISSFNYIEHKEELDPYFDSIWTVSQNMHDDYNEFYLIVNNTSIKSLKDLENKKISVSKNIKWDQLFLQTTNPKSSYIYSKNESAALINTYFGRYDACVVSSYTYESMLELNPSLKKNITVLKKSEKIFLRHLIALPKNNLKKDLNLIKEAIINFSDSKTKRDIVSIFKVTNLNLIKKEEFSTLAKYYKKNSIYITEPNEK